MPNRIPTPGIPTPQVRTSKAAQPAAKPVPLPKGMSAAERQPVLKKLAAYGLTPTNG